MENWKAAGWQTCCAADGMEMGVAEKGSANKTKHWPTNSGRNFSSNKFQPSQSCRRRPLPIDYFWSIRKILDQKLRRFPIDALVVTLNVIREQV